MNDSEVLDAEELMQLALDATERSQTGPAIEYLKRLLALEPDKAEAHYLLGAQQAQVGMPDRAILSMERALALRPELDAARFQLGMLLLTNGRVPEADFVWKPLEALGDAHPFVLFKSGLLHLAKDEFHDCLSALERGIKANKLNEPLNVDMARIAEEVRGHVGPGAAPQAKQEAPSDVPAMFLDAYKSKPH